MTRQDQHDQLASLGPLPLIFNGGPTESPRL